MYKRETVSQLLRRFEEQPRRLSIVHGPRRVGKTIAVQTAVGENNLFAADAPRRWTSRGAVTSDVAIPAGTVADAEWLEKLWLQARRSPPMKHGKYGVLAIDEVQKIRGWDNLVKGLWDEDRRLNIDLHVVLLGSSIELLRKGMAETLRGRFEALPMTHWSYLEMNEAFGLEVDEYCFFGGYPGFVPYIGDHRRWQQLVRDEITGPVLYQEIRDFERIDKPMMFEHMFRVACRMSSQVVSLTKVLQLLSEDGPVTGNVMTLSRYLQLYEAAGLVTALYPYAPNVTRERRSKPKFQVLNTALLTAYMPHSFEQAKASDVWGRIVESAVGAHLINSKGANDEIYYWKPRVGDGEVDFVVRTATDLFAIEVKAGTSGSDRWLREFRREHPKAKCFLVCDQPYRSQQDLVVTMPLAEALAKPLEEWPC